MLLMHKDTTVADFDIFDGKISNLKVLNAGHMPLGTYDVSVEETTVRLEKWIECRVISSDNPLEKALGKSQTEILRKTLENGCISLTDCYWFKPNDDKRKWKDVNFHANDFASEMFDAKISGEEYTGGVPLSPDITTPGLKEKEWVRLDKTPVLIKYGAKDVRQSANEVLSSRIGEAAGVANAGSQPVFIESSGEYTSASECFIENDDIEFISLQQFIDAYMPPDCDGQSVYDALSQMGFSKQISRMMLLDLITGNRSRSAENMGLIRDADTLDFIGFAPVFDMSYCFGLENEHPDMSLNPLDFDREKAVAYCAEEMKDINMEEIEKAAKEVCDVFELPEEYYQNVMETVKENVKEIEECKEMIEEREEREETEEK